MISQSNFGILLLKHELIRRSCSCIWRSVKIWHWDWAREKAQGRNVCLHWGNPCLIVWACLFSKTLRKIWLDLGLRCANVVWYHQEIIIFQTLRNLCEVMKQNKEKNYYYLKSRAYIKGRQQIRETFYQKPLLSFHFILFIFSKLSLLIIKENLNFSWTGLGNSTFTHISSWINQGWIEQTFRIPEHMGIFFLRIRE